MNQPVPGDLAGLLAQLRLQAANSASQPEASAAGIELLLARIAALTGTLRAQSVDDNSRAAARLLLADLAMVAAHFRGDMTSVGERLTRALHDVQDAVERAGASPAIEPE